VSDVRLGTPTGRWVLAASVLGSAVAALDATVVNVALPAIRRDLGGGLTGLQWIITGYLLTLAAFILLGGSLGDRYGRRRVFVVGVVWFALSSLLCGLAPNVGVLTAARALQGIGGALLTPGSLAIIEATFHPDDRGRAIGMWSGLGGVATAVGPPLGGWLITSFSWRLIFLLNLPLGLITILVAVRHVPESKDETMAPGIDVAGALLGVVGLAATTYALIEARNANARPRVVLAAVVGVVALVVFVLNEARSAHPSSAHGSSPRPTSSRSSCTAPSAARSSSSSCSCRRHSDIRPRPRERRLCPSPPSCLCFRRVPAPWRSASGPAYL
jgi:EmrB/QacA subfamily drug resistance transporter